MTLPTDAPSIAGITETSPAAIGDKTSVVRLSDEIKEWQAALSPAGSTAYRARNVPAYVSTDGKVVITADRDGCDVSLHVVIDPSVTLPGGVGLVGGATNIIPAAWRPRQVVYGAAAMNGTPSVLELDAAGTLKYLTGATSQPGLTGTIAYKVAG